MIRPPAPPPPAQPPQPLPDDGDLRAHSSLGMVSPESEQRRLDTRDVSGPGRSHSIVRSSVRSSLDTVAEQVAHTNNPEDPDAPQSRPAAESTSVQPPSYNEATERISIFIDASALQAIQDSRGSFSVDLLEKIGAAQRDQYRFQGTPSPCTHRPISQSFAPPAQTTRRPLPPLPLAARSNSRRPENDEAGYAHPCGGITHPKHPMHQNTPDEVTTRSCDKCECTLAHHPQLGKVLPKDENRSRPGCCNFAAALMYTKKPGRSEAEAAAQVPANRRVEVVSPPHSRATAEETLHIDELNVAERKPLTKMEKALLRKVEFGAKVDNSILQLC